MVQQKINAYRDFAERFAAQLVESMTAEFAREAGELWNDVCMYRDELDRVAQLLGSQLEREKKLHGVIEQMVGHSQNVQNQAFSLAQRRSPSDQVHQMLEQHMASHNDLMNQTLQGVSEANQALGAYYQGAQQFKEPMVTAENEFMRIVEMLRNPPIHEARGPPMPGQIQSPPSYMSSQMPPPSVGQLARPVGIYQGPPGQGQMMRPPMEAVAQYQGGGSPQQMSTPPPMGAGRR